ncbi:uncharacterized protein VTP21DRAFT_11369 [Calcarisporiella thermophila]|uniref:uncharacterized protein n=1 Tax=Calcarisporiella thermophila TaxID=911321 RepID=UPI00374268F2
MDDNSNSTRPCSAITTTFIKKLTNMLEDKSVEGIVSWGTYNNLDTFVIKDPGEFQANVLPKFFKYDIQSFLRQLNKHGFNKVQNADPQEGVEIWEFLNPKFTRKKHFHLGKIKLKLSTPRKFVSYVPAKKVGALNAHSENERSPRPSREETSRPQDPIPGYGETKETRGAVDARMDARNEEHQQRAMMGEMDDAAVYREGDGSGMEIEDARLHSDALASTPLSLTIPASLESAIGFWPPGDALASRACTEALATTYVGYGSQLAVAPLSLYETAPFAITAARSTALAGGGLCSISNAEPVFCENFQPILAEPASITDTVEGDGTLTGKAALCNQADGSNWVLDVPVVESPCGFGEDDRGIQADTRNSGVYL